ncbi:MAG: polysaccharide deacetylase family protein [Bacteroidetes bacterium]|nr:polysaccharide deacetylase family protein [Bacteroidota bacterium]
MNWFTHNGKVFKPFYPTLNWDRPTSEKKVFLTFDDGPTPEVTEYVLSVLKDFGFKATFFCIGENVSKNISIYKQIKAEGHQVGNHTYTHINGFRASNATYIKDTKRAAELIDSTLFRPPFGRIKRSQIRRLNPNFDIIMWSILSGDFDTTLNISRAEARMKSLTKPGAIIVFHDSQKAYKNLKALLPKYCAYLTDKGYTSCGL